MPKLSIDSLTVRYGEGENAVTPLDAFTAEVPEGTLAVLLGPSGCGKTTLLSCVAGIQHPTDGAITFGDTEVTSLDAAGLNTYRSGTVGIVFQGFNLVPSLNALENVSVSLRAAAVPRREGPSPRRQPCSRRWGSPNASRITRTASRAASSNESRSPGRSPSTRR